MHVCSIFLPFSVYQKTQQLATLVFPGRLTLNKLVPVTPLPRHEQLTIGDLVKVLADPVICRHFRQFLSDEYSQENIGKQTTNVFDPEFCSR